MAIVNEINSFLESNLENTFALYEAEMQFNKNSNNGFGNVLIMAGGAGSGKGFVLSNLVGLKGKVLDVDQLKKLAFSTNRLYDEMKKEIPGLNGIESLSDPKLTSDVHEFLNITKLLPDKVQKTLFSSIMMSHPDRRPNLIFDITLKDISKLVNLDVSLKRLGYKKENVHLVWVVNDLDVALDQNAKRDRKVDERILKNTHVGAAMTMKNIIDKTFDISDILDGDIYIAFNKVNVDNLLKKSEHGGSFVSDANYIHLKQSGKPVDKSKLTAEVIKKIKSYVPKGSGW